MFFFQGTKYQATVDHYGCPWPKEFSTESNLRRKAPFSDMWFKIWEQTSRQVEAFLNVSQGGRLKPSNVMMNRYLKKQVKILL